MQSSDLPCTAPDQEVPYSSGKVEDRFWNQVDHAVCHELTSRKQKVTSWRREHPRSYCSSTITWKIYVNQVHCLWARSRGGGVLTVYFLRMCTVGRCHQTRFIPHMTSVLFFLPQGKWRLVLWRHSALTSAFETATFRNLRTSYTPRDLHAASKRTSFTGVAVNAPSAGSRHGTLQVRMLKTWKAHDNRSW
jgi:hypothetical protein